MSGTASDNVWIDEVMATAVLEAPVAPNLRSRETLGTKLEFLIYILLPLSHRFVR